ncbi:uncharacterized protein WM294_012231 [Sarcoramphus papa]
MRGGLSALSVLPLLVSVHSQQLKSVSEDALQTGVKAPGGYRSLAFKEGKSSAQEGSKGAPWGAISTWLPSAIACYWFAFSKSGGWGRCGSPRAEGLQGAGLGCRGLYLMLLAWSLLTCETKSGACAAINSCQPGSRLRPLQPGSEEATKAVSGTLGNAPLHPQGLGHLALTESPGHACARLSHGSSKRQGCSLEWGLHPAAVPGWPGAPGGRLVPAPAPGRESGLARILQHNSGVVLLGAVTCAVCTGRLKSGCEQAEAQAGKGSCFGQGAGVPGAKGAAPALPGPVSSPGTGSRSVWLPAHPSPAGQLGSAAGGTWPAAVPEPAVTSCGTCSPTPLPLQLGADLPGPFSSLGPGPGRAFGKMFSPLGCRRGFPREPGPWQAGPPPPRAHGPHDVWDELPWEHQHRRGRGGWHPPGPWDSRPFPGPADFHGNEEDRRWAPRDCPPPPPWANGEDNRGPEDCFGEGWRRPGPWDSRPFPGPADFRENEEDRRWAPRDCPPPPPWDDRENNRGPEDCFGEGWRREPPLPGPSCFAWPEFPDEEQHPLWPPASLPGERDGFQDGCPSWAYRGLGGRRCRHLRHGHQELTLVQRLPCPWPSRGNQPSSRSSPSLSGTSRPGVKEVPQHPDPPQPLTTCKDGAQRKEQMAQGPPVVSGKVPEPPGLASTPQKSLAADAQAVTEAAEPEQAAGATLVEPGARQKPVGSHSQGPSALETEPAPLEKSSAGTGEHPEVELCSQSVPKAGAGGGSHPHGPTAPPEPAEGVRTAAGSAGEVGAELCPCSRGRQHLPSGAGGAKAEAARDVLLGGLQPSENSQVPPGATTEPEAQPSQACSDICVAPETSPGTQHPPGSGETEPAAGGQRRLCSTLPAPSPASTDLRSAAVLARKEEIELSYQQFSLTIAVVATMLLQKEPSMEAALGLALRANLRQGRIHHLQELEDFINSYDSATVSR